MQKIPPLELKILNVLWDAHTPCSVQEVIDRWTDEKPGYTTILKKLQIMEKKGLVMHEKEGRLYRYNAQIEREEVREFRLSELMDDLFNSSPQQLFSSLLGSGKVRKEDLDVLKNMIEEEGTDD